MPFTSTAMTIHTRLVVMVLDLLILSEESLVLSSDGSAIYFEPHVG